jgi:hypothetical protein
MFERRSGGVVDTFRRLFKRSEEPIFDMARRVVPQGEELYRFAWRLEYRNGCTVAQYERSGDVLIQAAFGKLERRGIRRVEIYDLEQHPEDVLAWVDVPEEAEVDIVYHCEFDPVSRTTHRVSTFGWFTRTSKYYMHFDPGTETSPPRIFDSASRMP